MKHTAARVFLRLCGMVVMLALAAGITSIPVLAASNRIYIASATPHYRHPVTGIIEDSGGENAAVLGQSMTDSATYKKALVEMDSDGNTYITVRLKLMDNISNPQFQTDGAPVSASLMQEDYTENTADYRIRVQDENSVIRCSMYVIPMGRDVIFYITVSDLKEGSGDFVTSIKADTQSPSDTSAQETKAPDSTREQAGHTSAPESTAPVPDTSKNAGSDGKATGDIPFSGDNASGSVSESSQTPVKDGSVDSRKQETTAKSGDKNPQGLQEFDASGNLVDNETKAGSENQEKSDSDKKPAIIAISVATAIVIGGAIWYFAFYKKKN